MFIAAQVTAEISIAVENLPLPGRDDKRNKLTRRDDKQKETYPTEMGYKKNCCCRSGAAVVPPWTSLSY